MELSKAVVVSDIHGNYPALDRVVSREGRDATYFVLGDIHGLNSYPAKTQALVREIGDYILAGNHDKAISEYGEGHVVAEALSDHELYHTLTNLSPEQVEWLLSLPHMGVEQIGDNRVAYTHARPSSGQASGYEQGNTGLRKSALLRIASLVGDDYDWVLHGHTHTQYDQDATKWGHDVHFVNPGSLGYDHTYTVVNFETGAVEHSSVEVETDVAAHIDTVLPDDAPVTDEWL